jgi:hypothetical protein
MHGEIQQCVGIITIVSRIKLAAHSQLLKLVSGTPVESYIIFISNEIK